MLDFGGMSMFHGVGFIFWLVIVLVILAIFMSMREKASESAIDILNKRLARGEISKEEYDELKEKII